MKFLLLTVLALLSVFISQANVYACAAPRPFFSDIAQADAVVRGIFQNYEVLTPSHEARVTFEIVEILKGDIQHGPLSVRWKRSELPNQWEEPFDVILSLKRSQTPYDEGYEIMRGCMVKGIYQSGKDRKLVLDILNKNIR